MDNLFEQFANISKAHGYDVLAEQVQELKTENEKLQAENTRLRDINDFLVDGLDRISKWGAANEKDFIVGTVKALLQKSLTNK